MLKAIARKVKKPILAGPESVMGRKGGRGKG
jgi:hypothetical protein